MYEIHLCWQWHCNWIFQCLVWETSLFGLTNFYLLHWTRLVAGWITTMFISKGSHSGLESWKKIDDKLSLSINLKVIAGALHFCLEWQSDKIKIISNIIAGRTFFIRIHLSKFWAHVLETSPNFADALYWNKDFGILEIPVLCAVIARWWGSLLSRFNSPSHARLLIDMFLKASIRWHEKNNWGLDLNLTAICYIFCIISKCVIENLIQIRWSKNDQPEMRPYNVSRSQEKHGLPFVSVQAVWFIVI